MSVPVYAPRCTQCGNACETAHYDPVALRCKRRHAFEATWPTHGEKRTIQLSWRALLRGDWRRAWLARGAGGPMVVEGCPSCERAVTLDPNTELSYGCTHCGERSTVKAGQGLLDILPESTMHRPMWALFHSEVTIGPFLHRSAGSAISCPSCGSHTDPIDGRGECTHCQTTLLALTSCGQRFIPGLRVTGVHQGTPLNGWMTVSEGLDYFERYRRYVRRSPAATLGAPASILVGVICMPIPVVLFVASGVMAEVVLTIASIPGLDFLAPVGMAFAAGSFGGWGLAAIALAIAAFGVPIVPLILNTAIKRRMGMHRRPNIHKLPVS